MRLALVAAAFCTLVSGRAMAMLPESGWYWNPSESGRGFNVEVQDDKLFVSGFVYDSAGNPQWFVSGGAMSSDRAYSGLAYTTTGGQCLGCAYRPPSMIALGPLTLTFSSEQTATLTLAGNTVALQREQFGYDFTSITQPLLGEWATIEGSKNYGLYFGERISMTGTTLTNSGPIARGTRTGDSHVAVGYFDASTGVWAILLDSSTSYYKLYIFHFTGFNRIEGDVFIYLKGTSPNASSPFLASRIRGPAAAAGQNAAGTDKSAPAFDRSQIDAVSTAAGETAQREMLVVKRGLARTLEALIPR